MSSAVQEWHYPAAFARNRGLVSADGQERLRRATVAIAGAGGVGGSHALTLARQGVGGFKLIDPDTFSVVNFNRQVGAKVSSLGQGKAEEIGRMIRDVNPEARVEAHTAALDAGNVDSFLSGVDVVLDGLDFFALPARRLLFAKAREKGLWTITAGPLGFSSALLAFSPTGMSFDRYFDLGGNLVDDLVAFLIGLAPRATHLPYTDFSDVDAANGAAPSSIIGCQLSSVLVAMETVRLLLGHGEPAAAPHYCQLDVRRQLLRRGRLWLGNRGPLQRLKRWVARRRFEAMGITARLEKAHGR